MAETTLLSMRPTRLISSGHYVLWIILWVLAVVTYLNPYGVIPAWSIPAINVRVQTFLAWLLGALGFGEMLIAEVKRRQIQYVVTDNRIIRRDGILRRRTMEIPFTQIERVELQQGVLQRVLGMGDIVLDTGEDTLTFGSLRHVKLVHDELAKHVGIYSRPPSMR